MNSVVKTWIRWLIGSKADLSPDPLRACELRLKCLLSETEEELGRLEIEGFVFPQKAKRYWGKLNLRSLKVIQLVHGVVLRRSTTWTKLKA